LGPDTEISPHSTTEVCSVAVVTPSYAVPAGWVSKSSSRNPLSLVNAFSYSKMSTPPPDQWTHFAKLRPVPWRLLLACIVIALVCAWGIYGTLTQFGTEIVAALFPLIVMGAGLVFFGRAAVLSVLSYRSRTGWPHLHGLGIGASGVAFRLTGGDSDVPWEYITSISATFTNADNPRKANIPVLRVEYAGSHVDLGTDILGASPLVIYWALLYYWLTPRSRDELGTTVAQQRMDDWLAQLTPTPVASGAPSAPGPN
jgi:hypothetical protein